MTLLDPGAGHPAQVSGADHVTIHRLGPQDWQAHRDLRLRMLEDAPDAFWADHEAERSRSPEQWQALLRGPRIHLQARRSDGSTIGGVGLLPAGYDAADVVDEDQAHLVSMWVAPEGRGGGISRLLFRAVAELTISLGRPRLTLDVDSDNPAARRSYERAGFRATGARHPREGRSTAWVEHEIDAHALLEL